MSVLTTAQLTFYDITDGDIGFTIFSQGTNNDGTITLKAIVTDKGDEVINGQYKWYKYDNATNDFALEVGSTQTITVDFVEDDVYKCDFAYELTPSNIAYTAYFNISTRRMVYTSEPSDGKYLAGDLWLVGDDYVFTDSNGKELSNTMLIAIYDGNGAYKHTDWKEAFDYNNRIDDANNKIDAEKERVDDLNNFRTELTHRVNWTSDGGLTFNGGIYDETSSGEKQWVPSPFSSRFDSKELAFYYQDKDDKSIKVAWISGDTDLGDDHPQFYVQDAVIDNNLTVNGETTVSDKLFINNTTANNKLIFQAEENGSYSILIDNS